MRVISVGLAASISLLVVAASWGSPQKMRPQEGAQLGQVVAPLVTTSLDDENEIAGLSKLSKPEVLGWERVYALAVVRARAGRGALLQSLDPAALGQQADRLGVADFARFRKDFFAGGAFRDPASDMFTLLGRRQAIDNTRRRLALLENLIKLLIERIQDQSSGLTRVELDTVFVAKVKASQTLDHQKRQFRDGLDELKVALGLSPQAAVILDRKAMAGFREVFDSVANWERQPERHAGRLIEIINELPELGDVTLAGQPAVGVIDVDPDRWQEIFNNAARLGLPNRGDLAKAGADEGASAGLELKTRSRVRHLVEMRRAYEDAKHGYELAVRIKDQAFERMLTPPSDEAPGRSLSLERYVEQVQNVTATEDQLAELWTAFRAKRLALYQEIGVLPYTDWTVFYSELTTSPERPTDLRSKG